MKEAEINYWSIQLQYLCEYGLLITAYVFFGHGAMHMKLHPWFLKNHNLYASKQKKYFTQSWYSITSGPYLSVAGIFLSRKERGCCGLQGYWDQSVRTCTDWIHKVCLQLFLSWKLPLLETLNVLPSDSNISLLCTSLLFLSSTHSWQLYYIAGSGADLTHFHEC